MVMHARKTQRMNDGFFEKHQAHPYQNSKYSSSKGYGSSSDRYEKFRDSPNGNYRSDSPDSQSPRDRDRSYQKASFIKMRDKERENRDYKVSRDKYSDCARSPKQRSRESEHRTNNDRNDDKLIMHPVKQTLPRDRKPMHNNCIDKREDRERVARVGDWSEHVSSSGKKYYYNCKTEVSQWEKPREWIERERDRFRRDRDRDHRERDRDRDRESDRCYTSRSGMRHDKHSNSRGSNSSSSKDVRDGATGSRHWSSGSSREDSDPKDSKRKHDDIQAAQDMDISPAGSTPTSELSYGVGEPVGPVLLANALPRMMSHGGATPCRGEASPQATVTSNAPGPPRLEDKRERDSAVHNSTLSVDTNHVVNDGPPTPTHNEVPECGTKAVAVPINSPPGTLSTLQGMSSSLQALRPQGPTITPSLANHYRDDLVNHVRGWPAEIIEKQAQKLAEEAHTMGSIQCSKVSAELKSARSIVRLTEIQATLQEQRILFLRQQIKELEELKSQNSFMSDDS